MLNTIATTATTTPATVEPAQKPPKIEYGSACVGDILVRETKTVRGNRTVFPKVEIDGRVVKPTKRFWRSFFSRFGIAENVFRYFSADEVFHRISDRNKNSTFRYCVAEHDDRAELLAITNLNRPVIRHGEICDLIDRYGGQNITYHEGIVTSTHEPRGGARQFAIGGDQFRDRFVMETPVDGFGHPRLFLSLLRLVCSNGAIGYSRAFRSDVPVGKQMDHSIGRALESYDNGDGYAALRQRFESAQNSWASVRECLVLGQTLEKLYSTHDVLTPGLLGQFRSLAGNLAELYGLANLEALSDKRRRILPARCRVYDLINFASEVATHHAKQAGANRMQAYIGSLISDEFDLEGTATEAVDFDAFFVKPSQIDSSLN